MADQETIIREIEGKSLERIQDLDTNIDIQREERQNKRFLKDQGID